ncbi:MAG: Non-reducing end beta-L-arabinofuranosidase [Acidimicrobiales bacterium]|nr:MAG: glycoside hydrolase family 127 protein [Actinomycetota bacterium]MBV6509630.1 Non-reducing end beta-L-arabinofuranosidase [Acidimicrobiales bacterium]RIK06325.1 MAG: hypothetical protein DCC48_07835 [Acidobacteriota bacterium]
MPDTETRPLSVDLADGFWAPRRQQLRDHTLPVILDRFDEAGSLDAFRRMLPGAPPRERRGMWFSDSDVYKWMEAAAWVGRLDLLDPVVELVQAAARPDGYLNSFYDVGPGSQERYRDLSTSHEWYCAGHFTEAALAHQAVTGEAVLLELACRWADHLCESFGPGRDERTDGHPEAELALARLARRTGEQRYLDQARWIIEHQLNAAGLSLQTVDLAGHAVKALYLATGIAEVADATGDPLWQEAVRRLFCTLVEQRSYPTGAVGGRWLDESVGKPYELPEAMAYAESCAAVASVRFCRRVWDLTSDPRALDQIETLLYNAVPCGVGADGESWFYSQPHAVAEVAAESNPWALPFEYGQSMLLSWFPTRRHRWFDVACCPPNLARMFATVDQHVAGLSDSGDLLVHLPLSARIRGGGWDVALQSGYPDEGVVAVDVLSSPDRGQVRLRVPGWAGGAGHIELPTDGRIDLGVAAEWWESDRRVEGAAGTVFLRRGPVVRCVEGLDAGGVDLRDLVVDPRQAPVGAFGRVVGPSAAALHHRLGAEPPVEPVTGLATVPYHAWANRGPTTMRIRFPRIRR